jgi:predicted O-methyltransferase YrrM
LQTKSWFDFDNFYSDSVFPIIVQQVQAYQPKNILDIGANTGKFSIQCLQQMPDIQMHLLDYPGQLAMAEKNIHEAGIQGRHHLIPHNILEFEKEIPGKFDIIWMSQFLDCFSDDEIIGILKKCKKALNPGGVILVNETFWDKQPFHAAMYSLQMTSLYFTTQANGNSQMYDSRVFLKLIEASGLKTLKEEHQIATTHSLLTIQ